MGCVMSSSGIDRMTSWVTEPLRPLSTPGPLEDRRQVGVHVAGVAAPARHLLARRRHLAERLAVVGHVGEDHEHVDVTLEGEVLGGGQRERGA